MKTTLIGFDGSESAGRAVSLATRLACAFSAGLIIVTTIHSVVDRNLQEFSRAERATLGDIMESIARTHVSQARVIAEKSGATVMRTDTRYGEPAEVILAMSREFAADVIVVGKRGQGRLAGLLLGSVSQKLIMLADRPVVVVP